MNPQQLKNIIESALLASDEPLSRERLSALFDEDVRPDKETLAGVLAEIQADWEGRGIELREVASGFRFQLRREMAPWVSRLWEERPARYSRALLETLALIAYRQPITRAEIEDIRGVTVSTSIMKTVQERGWVRIVGHRDVPGKPAMYATTRQFLDYFSLRGLDELPPLAELRDIDRINEELDLRLPGVDRAEPDDDDQRRLPESATPSVAEGEEEAVSGGVEAEDPPAPDGEAVAD